MAINIGDAKSLGHVENWAVVPDDRQTMQPILDDPYNVVIDNGKHDSGDKYSFSAYFSDANWELIKSYWLNRTKVTVVTEGGESLASKRVVVKSYTLPNGFEKTHTKATLELWGC